MGGSGLCTVGPPLEGQEKGQKGSDLIFMDSGGDKWDLWFTPVVPTHRGGN